MTMARFSGHTDESIKSESETFDAVWSEEYERVPLKQRLKLLLARNPDARSGIEIAANSEPPTNVAVGNHSNQCYSQEEKIDVFGVQQNGEVKECVFQTEGDKSIGQSQIIADNIMLGKVDAADCTSLQPLLPSDLPLKTKVSAVNSLKKCVNCSSGADLETTVKIKNETPDDFLDDLDFVVLKERQRMLLSRRALSLECKIVERTSPALSSLAEDDWIKKGTGVGKGDDISSDKGFPMAGDHFKTSNLSNFMVHGLSDSNQREYSSDLVTSKEIKGNDWLYSSKKTPPKQESSHGLDLSFDSSKVGLSSAIVNVKVELQDNIELGTIGKHATFNPPYDYSLPVKRELDDSCIDTLDHMLLRERMKLFSKKATASVGSDGLAASLSKIVPSVVNSTPIASAKPLKVGPRKRRKTATDSVELALEEDAPGLLKVLLEKGVSVDEIKLYGEPESNEAMDESFTEDSFTELEEIISKLFTRRHSLFKLGPMHFSKGEKASYCLACLFSLVEQARYLQFRKWPVEWGWCRDLQSFIFVFERHNRIVLERPEYGYATYFFELVEPLPIHWQIKRLVTAMKLTSCSRVSLIENRALLVGEDLTEGEAKVLKDYGWIPNTGLGSMLNYCDRVVHDRKHENDTSEWRSKIGKMLVDGYNGGKIVPTETPMNLAGEDSEFKLEMD